MDKDVVHIYNEILLSYKKEEIWSSVDMWMHLESVIQNEVSQKEYNKFIKAYMWNLEKCYW